MLGYPVFYDQSPSVDRNRVTVFFRYFMAIPLFFVAFFYAIGFFAAVVVAWFALLFTGQWPAGLYNFACGFLRFMTRVQAYFYCITDVYPPFDGGEHPEYPVRLQIGPPAAEYNRLKVFFRYFYALPVLIVNYALGIWLMVVAIGLWFSAVFTGRTSESLLEAQRMPMAYAARTMSLIGLVVEDWPPFNPGATPDAQPQVAGLA